MIKYVCYDTYGRVEFELVQETETLQTVIIHRNGHFYRPIHYELTEEPALAKCIPVNVIEATSGVVQDGEVSTDS